MSESDIITFTILEYFLYIYPNPRDIYIYIANLGSLGWLNILYIYIKLFKTFGALKIFLMNYLCHSLGLLCDNLVVENSPGDV